MTGLRIESLEMPAARLGPPSPLPPLESLERVHDDIEIHDNVPEDARTYLGYGLDAGILPYTLQDDYDRDKQDRSFRVAVLENDVIRATFLLEGGGRLWSLIHKPANRELLYANPVFQPANVATRSAWLAGGVEWNCSIQGHTPFTCSPLFAARLEAGDGTPVLRLYEWERIRGVPFQLDVTLPEGSPWLLVHVRIVNPHDVEIPMYWWSNIAVRERPDVRVIVPADHAYNFGYAGVMKRIPLPVYDGVDRTYATNATTSADAFYELPEGERPWIAAVGEDGRGLIQTSTSRLRGRKLFVWGMSAGGRHWQDFLAQPGWAYLEIQAGLARTQMECIPMPANAVWSWQEAYGLVETDPDTAHGEDWSAARRHVQARLDETLSAVDLEDAFAQGKETAERPPDELIQHGSGWAALERRRATQADMSTDWGSRMVFDDESLGDEQALWLELLETGAMPQRQPSEAPGGWMVQREWHELLEDALAQGRGDHWLAWLHLGVMRYHASDADGAEQAWKRSVSLEPSAWALRNLAVLAKHRDDPGRAAEQWLEAHRLLPGQTQLAIECATALLAAGRPADVLALCDAAPAHVRDNPRIRVVQATAHLELGRLDEVEAFLAQTGDVPDVREGEVSLTDLWFSLHEKRIAAPENIPIDDALRQRVQREFPPPPRIDFRMT